jgi:hypothetical protein
MTTKSSDFKITFCHGSDFSNECPIRDIYNNNLRQMTIRESSVNENRIVFVMFYLETLKNVNFNPQNHIDCLVDHLICLGTNIYFDKYSHGDELDCDLYIKLFQRVREFILNFGHGDLISLNKLFGDKIVKYFWCSTFLKQWCMNQIVDVPDMTIYNNTLQLNTSVQMYLRPGQIFRSLEFGNQRKKDIIIYNLFQILVGIDSDSSEWNYILDVFRFNEEDGLIKLRNRSISKTKPSNLYYYLVDNDETRTFFIDSLLKAKFYCGNAQRYWQDCLFECIFQLEYNRVVKLPFENYDELFQTFIQLKKYEMKYGIYNSHDVSLVKCYSYLIEQYNAIDIFYEMKKYICSSKDDYTIITSELRSIVIDLGDYRNLINQTIHMLYHAFYNSDKVQVGNIVAVLFYLFTLLFPDEFDNDVLSCLISSNAMHYPMIIVTTDFELEIPSFKYQINTRQNEKINVNLIISCAIENVDVWGRLFEKIPLLLHSVGEKEFSQKIKTNPELVKRLTDMYPILLFSIKPTKYRTIW